MIKRRLIFILGSVALAAWVIWARSYTIPVRRMGATAAPVTGIVDREKTNGPREVMKSQYFYEKKLQPELTKQGVACSQFSWKYLMPAVSVGDRELIVFILRPSRYEAEAIRDAASSGIADFEFPNEDWE